MSTDLFGVRVLGVEPERRLLRLRVFVVYYEPAWGTHLLPDDPSFFFRVLWEGAEEHGTGGTAKPLTDLVDIGEFLDQDWVDTHTRRFVARVDRVATRNHPLDAEAWNRLDTFYYERDGRWQDEHLLAQGDYEVEVTDSRWLEGLYSGAAWGTTACSTAAAPSGGADTDALETEDGYRFDAADGSVHAAFVLGWLRQEKGDLDGAEEAYQQAVDGDHPIHRAKALLYLGHLHADRGDSVAADHAYRMCIAGHSPGEAGAYPVRAALAMGTIERRSGDEDGAVTAFTDAADLAESGAHFDLVREARRLAGIETPAEAALRMLAESGPDAAERVLTAACGSAAAARFGTALAQRDEVSARVALTAMTDPADLERAAALLIDLATVRSPRVGEAADEALRMCLATGKPAEGLHRLLTAGPTGSVTAARLARWEKAGLELFRLLEKDGGSADLARLGTAAEQRIPSVAGRAFNRLGTDARDRGDPDEAAAWLRRGAALTDPDPEIAAVPACNLGLLHTAQDAPDAACAAFAQAEDGLRKFRERVAAARRQAELRNRQSDWQTASANWIRAARHQADALGDGAAAEWTIYRLGDRLAAAGEAHAAQQAYRLAGRHPETGGHPAAETYATYHFARWVGDGGHRRLATELMRDLAGLDEAHADDAMLWLSVDAYRSGDTDAARTWAVRAAEAGTEEVAHRATMNLAVLAQERREPPESFLRLLGPVAESAHADAALAAGYIAEAYDLRGDTADAIGWYQRTLEDAADADDPELIGEAAYCIGEMLCGRAEPGAARPYLEQAVSSGDAAYAQKAASLLAETADWAGGDR
ncbi:hypothetical protein GCM10027570_07750 [Streptomonospora sediminis]